MKKINLLSITLALSLFVLGIGSSGVSAAANKDSYSVPVEKITSSFKIGKGVTASKFSDGRVEGMDPSSLDESQKDEVLRLMNFSEEEVNNFPEELVNKLITTGGVKVTTTQSNLEQTYTSLAGVDYVITEENKDEVNKIKEEDKNTLSNNLISTLSMGSKQDGTWSGYGALFFSGKTSNGLEYNYSYLTYFNWSETPFWPYSDKIAMSYQNNATRVGSSGVYYSNPAQSTLSIDTSSIYGISTSYNIMGEGYGYIKADVRIPTNQTGYTGLFNSAYGHPWLPSGMAVNIGGYGSISLTGQGDKWTWDNTFTIGQAY